MSSALGEVLKKEQSTLINLQKAFNPVGSSLNKKQLGESHHPEVNVNFHDPGPTVDFPKRVHQVSEAADAAVRNAKALQKALKHDKKTVEAQSRSILKAMRGVKRHLDSDIRSNGDVAIEQDIMDKAKDERWQMTHGGKYKNLGESVKYAPSHWQYAQQQPPNSQATQDQAAAPQQGQKAPTSLMNTWGDPEPGTDASQATKQRATSVSGVSTPSAATTRSAVTAPSVVSTPSVSATGVSNTVDHQAIAKDADKLRQFQANALKKMDKQQALFGKANAVFGSSALNDGTLP